MLKRSVRRLIRNNSYPQIHNLCHYLNSKKIRVQLSQVWKIDLTVKNNNKSGRSHFRITVVFDMSNSCPLGKVQKNKIKNVCYFHKPGLVVNKDGTLFRLLILFFLRFKVQIFTFLIFWWHLPFFGYIYVNCDILKTRQNWYNWDVFRPKIFKLKV